MSRRPRMLPRPWQTSRQLITIIIIIVISIIISVISFIIVIVLYYVISPPCPARVARWSREEARVARPSFYRRASRVPIIEASARACAPNNNNTNKY